jgi:GntR family transcriptional regulator
MSLNIRISKDSDVPLHKQVGAQIVLLIGSGKLKPGDVLPSIRELAMWLKTHRNTVVHAYEDLVLKLLVEKKQGSRLVVRHRKAAHAQGLEPIDDLINSFLAEAQRCDYTLRDLYPKFQQRMLSAPPDRVLVLSDDAGMRVLLSMELMQRLGCPVESHTVEQLASNPELVMGALVVSPPGHIPKIAGLLPPERLAVPITCSSADSHLDLIRGLDQSSLIARAVLAPATGRHHSMC